ncbi:hypothetical protein CEXT_340321 [Caerostris extrusa]|uniref:Uncharacterized protein n=1 Tax=Caerostris extrusa TaxID=172846 RepID=A0AAV4QUK6_CAEEX|nr:hypothetical protein CEXT_340321 [Caerostris extrusa]
MLSKGRFKRSYISATSFTLVEFQLTSSSESAENVSYLHCLSGSDGVEKEGNLQEVADSPDISISEFLSRANEEFLPKCSCIGTFTSISSIIFIAASEMLRNTFDFSDISPAT